MFTSPRPNLYEHSDGFSVEVLGIAGGLLYREGARQTEVRSDFMLDLKVSAMVVYRSSIRSWEQASGAEPITDADREKIIERIRDAFRFQGYEIEVE